MRNKIIILVVVLLSLAIAPSALAVCPVCTVAVTACVGLSRYLGVDDLISGVWIGAALMSVSLWTVNWLRKKNINFKYSKIILLLGSVILYYALALIPMFWTGFIGHPYNQYWWGMDKLVIGIIAGSIVFFLSAVLYGFLKKKHGDKPYFPFQKVVQPIVLLAILSGIFYYLLQC